MPLVPAICTQCGAQIEVDDTHEAGICKHCGTAFITEKAINQYTINITNNNSFAGANVTITTNIDTENLLNLASTCIEANDYTKAKEYIDEVLKYDVKNAMAWELKGKCASPESEITYIVKAIEYADEEQCKRLQRYYYYKWASAWDGSVFQVQYSSLCTPCRDAIPSDYIANDSQLQNVIINHVNTNYEKLIKQWDLDIRKYKYMKDNINKEIDFVNAWVEGWIKKMPSYRKDSFIKKEHYTKEACYIATCVYGSYDCPEVWTLRRFRDYTLVETWYGRLFIKCYYAISPTIVKWFGDTKWFKAFWKKKLDTMVFELNNKGIKNTHYQDKY